MWGQRKRDRLRPLDEAAAYARCHGDRDDNVRIVKLPPRRVRYDAVLSNGESIRRDFESKLDIPEADRDYYLERKYPSFGNLSPRDIASRAAKEACDDGRGVGPGGRGVYLDFADAIKRLGEDKIRERYGNLFEMYQRITDENPYKVPMRIYPAVHYTMGGLWVDYNLMSTIPGLHVAGEANFSDHGANRLGASALMQGLADGYFVLPYTIGDYLALEQARAGERRRARGEGRGGRRRAAHAQLLAINGKRTVASFHRELGKIMWEYCGMARNAAGLKKALELIPKLREEFWRDVNGPGRRRGAQPDARARGPRRRLPRARRADVPRRAASRGVVRRPLPRRVPDAGRRGAARRRATSRTSPPGSTTGEGQAAALNKEPLVYENIKLSQRSYK